MAYLDGFFKRYNDHQRKSRTMSRANYIYQIAKYSDKQVIGITDMNTGDMSVTNDIENIIINICKVEALNPHHCIIVYRDSEKIWDGYDWTMQQFVALQEDTWVKAVEKYLKESFS